MAPAFANKTIFIAPLDWGLGHATRDIPLIKILKENNKVIIGVTENCAHLFENYFPDLEKINLPSYNIQYSKKIPVWLKLLFQFPKINAAIKAEKKCLEKIVSENKIDIVISDNRFGLYNHKTKNIFLKKSLAKPRLFLFALLLRRFYGCFIRLTRFIHTHLKFLLSLKIYRPIKSL